MRITPVVRWIYGILLSVGLVAFAAEKPINALIITGGCCHNYAFQSQAITQAVAKVAQVKWTILQDPRTGTRGEIDLYKDPHWADPYDVIIHNECFADTDDAEYIRRITEAHRAGKPAMVIHCAMHTYRAAKVDDWREFLGVTSRRHDHMSKYPVKAADTKHPIMKDFPATWTTPPDELYVIEKLWPGAKALATSVSEEDGKTYPVAWVHEFGPARVFGTTFGHSDETFRDPVYLNLLSRAFLWTTGRLK
ncbi:MAG TPA: ThuA domain-containing protein [Verrucomicrobiae bacterium]